MDNCEKYNEDALPKKEDFYRHLMEDINDTDYAHAKRVCKGFEIKSLWEYHDLYVQSDIILLADKFENFRKLCINIYELDPAKFLSAPGLAWEEAKADILTDKDMLLLVEKCIRGAICHSIYRYGKANDKCIKNCDKSKEPSYFQYWDVNNLHGWAVLQKLPVNNFEWVKDNFQLNENFIKNCNHKSDVGYFFEVDVQHLEKLHVRHNDLPFLPERMKKKLKRF